jgi:hypothetical protein
MNEEKYDVNHCHICFGHSGRGGAVDIAQKDGKPENMKATLDIPDDLYKRVKARSALEGKAIRSVAIELFQKWIQAPSSTEDKNESALLTSEEYEKYPWLNLARTYINGNQPPGFAEIKKSIAMGWAKEVSLAREASDE